MHRFCGSYDLSLSNVTNIKNQIYTHNLNRLRSQTCLYKSELKELKYYYNMLEYDKKNSNSFFNFKGRVTHIGMLVRHYLSSKNKFLYSRYIRIADLIGKEVDVFLLDIKAVDIKFKLNH